jgi:TDG/mug DNA glycosylase family protein
VLSPFEERELLPLGYGITNVAPRPSAAADELSVDEIREGGKKLIGKVKRCKPDVLAVLGVGAYRIAFDRPKAQVGPQEETIGDTRIWILPNPSGLNAHYQSADLAKVFRQLRDEVG